MTETGVAVTAPRAPSITPPSRRSVPRRVPMGARPPGRVLPRVGRRGHVSDLRAAGSYLATDIAGSPVVIVRGADGALSAFHNVCRHRAGPLVWDGTGHVSSFVCRYHGWVYELDGRLRSPRDFGDDPPLDRGACGLFGATSTSGGALSGPTSTRRRPRSASPSGLRRGHGRFPMEELVPATNFPTRSSPTGRCTRRTTSRATTSPRPP